jgi:gliding motility-associated-like protein
MKKLLLVLAFILAMLGATAQTPYQQNYGDSLNGWNETAVKNELINHGVYGKEYFLTAPLLKRSYIDQKYNLRPILTNSVPSGKPLGGSSQINVAPCVNEDFELTTPGAYFGSGNSTAVSGWSISSRAVNGTCNNTNAWVPGSSKFWVVSTPITGIPAIGSLGASPLGGTNVIKMNNNLTPYSLITRISQTFPVTSANTVFQFAYAGVWEDGTHNCCEQPALMIKMYDCLGGPLSCSSLSLNAQGANCPTGAPGYSVSNGLSFTPNWVVKYIDLTPFIGSCVTIEIINSDCIFGGHYGMVFFDAKCGGQIIGTGIPGPGSNIAGPVSFCAGANQAIIAAPLGYNSYQWYGPFGIISPPQGTLSTLTINNPIPNTSYTVAMYAASGCSFTSVNTLTFTSVNIAGTNTMATCPGGASGTATVYGNGSGTGYTYTWTNSSNLVVGTTSVATGLSAGVYTIAISGFGISCGSQSTTVNIPSAPIPLTTFLKPYCGNTAYFSTNGGSNIQWYNNLTPVNTTTSYILVNPINGSFVHLRYTTSQGCQDSIKYILNVATPGAISILSNKLICVGGTNGETVIGMIPATGAPPGFNSYTVVSTGITPSFSSTINFSGLNTFSVAGLVAGGTYSVNTFDGSCAYTTNFTVPVHIWNYTLSANQYSFCPGQQTFAGANFTSTPSLSQYTYSWSPTTWLAGNFQNTIISPITNPGSSTTVIYTVIVTPTISSCAVTKTMAITAFNPSTPTINLIPNICNNSSPYFILVSPIGGTFNSTAIVNGVIQPNISNIGLNTFNYSVSLYTCVANSTATYEVSQFRNSNLTSTVPPLCVTNSPFNLMNIVQNTVGNWLGNGVTGNNFFNPSNLNTGNYLITYSVNSTPNPTVCPSTTTIGVSVTKTITPLINNVPEFCTNQTTINLSANPSGGTWGGNSAVSFIGVITPSLANVPSSTVGYTIVIGPCVNTAVKTLITSKFNTAALTGIISNLCYNSSTVNLMSIVASTVNGTWNGINVSNNIFSPSGLSTGNYILNYNTTSFPNNGLCPDSRTITVSVSNPPIPQISNVGPYCSNDGIKQMTVTPSVGTWQTNSYLNSTGVFNPNTAAVGNNIITYIIGSPTCNTQATKIVQVEAFVSADITAIIPDLCNNSSNISLVPFTVNSGGIWSGPGIVGSSFNPSVGAGTFVLKYSTASSPSGLCPDYDTIAVKVFSLAPPSISKVGPFCNSSLPINLNVTPVGGLFSGINNNAVSLTGLFNPAYGVIGDNYISYSITSGPCVANTQEIISIEKFIDAGFAKQVTPICENAVPINLNSFAEFPNNLWSGPSVVGTMFYPNNALKGNNKIYHYTHSMPTVTLCPDQDSLTIFVKETPKVVIIADRKSGCSPLEVLLNIPSQNTGNGIWMFDDGTKNQLDFLVSHVYTKPGVYNITFAYNDGICPVVTNKVDSIIVYESPKAAFYIPSEILISDKTQIVNLSEKLENNKYIWKVNSISYYDIHPFVEFPKVGNYKINLVASTIHGCKDSTTKYVSVYDEFSIYIPKSFTPNYDGLNDIFYPVIHFAKKYNLLIFDRWGELIYNQINGRWDGTFKGEIVKEDTYVFKIFVFKEDGSIIEKTGHITLLK